MKTRKYAGWAWAVSVAMLSVVALEADAALLSDNDLTGSTVIYSDITEDILGLGTGISGGTYGTPTISGDSLDFNPVGLIASGANGTYMETDAELQFYVQAKEGYYISDLQFSEAGDSRLRDIVGGGGTASTYTEVTATFFVDVLEIDGIPVTKSINGDFSETFGTFSLPADVGTINWSGLINLDIESLLDLDEIDYGATLLHVTLDNLLYAQSESGTTATIKKKDFDGFTVTAIPEPASLVLLVGTSGLVVFIRRKFIV